MLDLEQQNKFMNKVTLTGKINAMDVAANLFEFTDKTANIFDELKTELINALLDENIKKVTNELTFKAQTVIDILIRNLFERTADVGFLSTDAKIVDYLTVHKVNDAEMLTHLQEYAAKYSVYNEILLFDTEGNLQINLKKENKLTTSNDPIIQEALTSDSYIERYAHTDIFETQDKTLLYAQKIMDKKQAVGVLVLCFKFEDELGTIFQNLSQSPGTLALCDRKEVLTSSAKVPYIPYSEKPYNIIKNTTIAVTRKTSSYQGYRGIEEWYAIALMHLKDMPSLDLSLEEEEQSYSALLSQELQSIIKKANNILEDIADVIINGELIACKQKVYLLTPILDNLRTISMELLSSINKSIKNLEQVVRDGLVHDVKMAASLAVDIMDRNLYERANDSRWWALTQVFQEELACATPDQTKLQEELRYINALYTVYTNIILFDANKTIVATSNNQEIIGETIDGEFVDKTLHNTNSQYYFVSDFEKTPFYNNEATYIYTASIVNKNKVVGGVAVIFDATVEFKSMLEDSFPRAYSGFICFIDKNKKVISSNDDSIQPLSTLKISDDFVNFQNAEQIHCDFITFNEQKYIVASVASKGYREYKKEDNYKNDVYCVAFLRI